MKYHTYRVMADKDKMLGYIYAKNLDDALYKAQRLFYKDVFVEYVDEDEWWICIS